MLERTTEGAGELTLRFVGRSLAGCCAVALVGACGYILHIGAASAGFLFILIAVAEVVLAGFWPATAVCIAGILCLDFFFYTPYLSLRIDVARDWIALSAFEVTALTVSSISAAAHRHALEAATQRALIGQLHDLGRGLLFLNMHRAPGPQLAQLVKATFSLESVVIFEADRSETTTAGAVSEAERNAARICFVMNADSIDARTEVAACVLRAGMRPLGGVALRGDIPVPAARVLASMVAIALDRYASIEKENRIEEAHRSERLRTAVLDSLAHDLKTPLTAIHAASAGLIEVGVLNNAQMKLATLIEEEAIRLSDLSTRLLQTAQLESDAVALRKIEINVADLIGDVIGRHTDCIDGHSVEVTIAEPSLTVCGDPEMLTMVLMEFLSNAAKYSFADVPVRVSAWKHKSDFLLSVHNTGTLIPPEERELIFERYYRSSEANRIAAGTGVGLSIVKTAADAHHGHTWVTSSAAEGTTFYLSLPQTTRRASGRDAQ